jgi:hypothetical protein
MNAFQSMSTCNIGHSEAVRRGSLTAGSVLTAGSALAVLGGLICSGCSGSGDLPVLTAAPFVLLNEATHREVVETIGEYPGDDSAGFTHPVSERFGPKELRQLYKRLNSASFQASLTDYSGGDPVPRFTFKVTLYKASKALGGERRVGVAYSPALSETGRTRDLLLGLDGVVDKAFAEIDPAGADASRESSANGYESSRYVKKNAKGDIQN